MRPVIWSRSRERDRQWFRESRSKLLDLGLHPNLSLRLGHHLNHNEARSRPLSCLINDGGSGFGDFGSDRQCVVEKNPIGHQILHKPNLLHQSQRVHLHHQSDGALLHQKMQPQRLSQINTVEINTNRLKEWGWFVLDYWGLDRGMSFVGHVVWVMLFRS